LMTVSHQQPASVTGTMNYLIGAAHRSEQGLDQPQIRFVVISPDEHDPDAATDARGNLSYHRALHRVPVPVDSLVPSVHDVAVEVEMLGMVMPKKMEKCARFAHARAEMDIRNPNRSIPCLGIRTNGQRTAHRVIGRVVISCPAFRVHALTSTVQPDTNMIRTP